LISLKQLMYALAVEQTLHFKKAAELCHVSQSALSTAIIELEKQIDMQLFERNNKTVLVTEKGALFLIKAKAIKLALDELQQISQFSKQPLSVPMAIGVIPTIGPYLLPKVLPKVRDLYPDFKLRLVEEQSHRLINMVKSGELDAAVLALPYPIDGLLAFEFWQEDFYWVSHVDECQQHQQEINSNELELDKLMLLKEGHCLKDQALAVCGNQSTAHNNAYDATSLYTLVQMVAGKLGSTLVPKMALEQLVFQDKKLAAVHLHEPGPHRRIAFIIRPNYAGADSIEVLIQLFTQQLSAQSQST